MSTMTRPPTTARTGRLLRGLGRADRAVGDPGRRAGADGCPAPGPAHHPVPAAGGHRADPPRRRRLAVTVIAAGVWICWALFVVSLIAEIPAALGRRPARALPGLGTFQRAAGMLVAAVVIGLTAAAGLGRGPAAHAEPLPPLPTARTASSPASSITGAPTRTDAPVAAPRPTDESTPAPATPAALAPTYRVQPRDTLWRIAERHLGDPLRFREIITLNPAVIGADNEITAGTVLTLPPDAAGITSGQPTPGGPPDTVQVQVGDSLWSLEAQVTGDGANWPTAWAANRGRAEPGGDRFSDPDLIKPGWTLSIPAASTAPPAPGRQPGATAPHPPAPRHLTSAPPARRRAGHRSRADPPPAPRAGPAARHPDAGQASRPRPGTRVSDRYSWLQAGGGLLAATTLAALLAHRRRAQRHRRPGHLRAPLPQDLQPLERAVTAHGRPALSTMTFLDLALRDLADRIAAAPGRRLPDIAGAGINDNYLDPLPRRAAPRHRRPPRGSATGTGPAGRCGRDTDLPVDPPRAG